MGPDGVVVGSPSVDDRPNVGDVAEQTLVEAFITKSTDEALDEPCLLRLVRCDVVHSADRFSCQTRTAFEVISVPLSLTIISGQQ